MRLLFREVSINASLYMTQGVEQKYSYGGNTFGIRIGLTPFSNPFSMKRSKYSNFELGASYLYDIDGTGAESENIVAFDYESQTGALILRSEYYTRTKTIGVEQVGYHLTMGIDIEALNEFPLIITGRYDYYQEDNHIAASTEESSGSAEGTQEFLSRGTGGLTFNISDISFLKFEYQNYLTASEGYTEDEYYSQELYYMQLVITF